MTTPKKSDQLCEIIWNKEIGPGYYNMGLTATVPLTTAQAGQFVMLKPADVLTPILRRPLGIAQILTDNGKAIGISVIYRVVGEGTALMAKLQPGQNMEVLGPLGTYFLLPKEPRHIVLIGGGTGMPPMLCLARQTKDKYGDECKITVCIGGRSGSDVLGLDEFEKIGVDLAITTDDGSLGTKGVATMALLSMVEADKKPDGVFACGPTPMLKAVSGICLEAGIYCQISMEARMGCGIGACLGCAVKPAQGEGYLHVCKDGPVFNAGVLAL